MSNTNNSFTLSNEIILDKIKHFQDLIDNRNKLVFLLGAGCSKCADLPLITDLTSQVLSHSELGCKARKVLQAVSNNFPDETNAHIEHYISEIVDWLAIYQRRASLGATNNTMKVGNTFFQIDDLVETTHRIKQTIAHIIRRDVDISCHRDFVKSVHRPVRTGRPRSSTPVDYLVLNYDTIIEDALALEQVLYTDGLEGGRTAWWREGIFTENKWEARVIKLHGSIDWYELPNEPLPRRIGQHVDLRNSNDMPILIWPSSTKYKESQLDPFARLLEQARRALSSSRDVQCLLVICGYSFGDDHINLEVSRALYEKDADLTIVAFTKEDKPVGQLEKWHQDPIVKDRILIFAKRGFFHGDRKFCAKDALPWWKFESVTDILGGQYEQH